MMLRTVHLNTLNANITCSICGGYFVEATTIMECLHSFCKSCIVRYLETSCNCPVCQTEIHKTRPLLHVRPDPVLQDLVYKLVPSLYDDYHKAKQEFKKLMSTEEPAQEETHDADGVVNVPHLPDPIYVTLEQRQRNKNKNEQIKMFPIRYLRCPSSMPVRILKKFLRIKFFVKDSQEVEISRSDEVLFDHLTLKEVARIYGRYGKLAPLDLYFDVIPKDKVIDVEKNSYDGSIPSAVIPTSFNEKQDSKQDASQADISNENEVSENKMDVDSFPTDALTDANL
ncbi:polycomb complex protein BMI-1-like [Dendronephthya gigantea]|uniref:polycomb complex protein BMI-1-like n=1 Tax=Dendronephthya gigantea TaxID=151771 RepID=UPI00106A551F|nr:polycomb complex protein BMI-1-like [Dendronephthya gigantea]